MTKYNSLMKRFIMIIMVSFILIACMPVVVKAADQFDPVFYAVLYPDVVAAYGYNPDALYNHYVKYGQKEGRLPSTASKPGAKVNKPAAAATQTVSVPQTDTGIVAFNKIPNMSKIKKKCTDSEIKQAYNSALNIVRPLVNLSQEEQLDAVMSQLRAIFEARGTYSMSSNHYNDPYGYLILGSASCAGSTRTTILCLEMLGFTSVEHVHENKYCHQWARVRMNDGSYWICDPFGLYVGPEPAPYVHPYAQ